MTPIAHRPAPRPPAHVVSETAPTAEPRARSVRARRAPRIAWTFWALLIPCLFAQRPARAEVYEVGPGMSLTQLGEVPWESLGPGDEVRIHARPTPYAEKFVVCAQGTAQAPVVIRGIPGSGGELPVITGQDATTRSGLNFWNEARGVIKIGGANTPDCAVPSYVVLENLEIRGGRSSHTFTGRDGLTAYGDNAAAVFVEVARHLVLRNLVLTDSGNGLFVAAEDGETEDILVQGCHIHGNGNVGSIYEHNSYTAARGIVFEGNRYGPLCTGCPGNNLKDRSAGLVVRYNVIESGNRQLDLVDAEDSAALQNDPRYRETFVYGNLLIEPDGAGNSQIVHYGGDSGDDSIYRKGTLYFHHNTVVSTRSGNTTLFRLSTNDESVDARNNVVHVTAGGFRLAMVDGAGSLALRDNWMTGGFVDTHGTLTGSVVDLGGLTGTEPGFVSTASSDFHLAAGSPCIDQGGDLAAATLPAHRVVYQPLSPRGLEARPDEPPPDLGAFERCVAGGCANTNPDAGVVPIDSGVMPSDAGGPSTTRTSTGCGCHVVGDAPSPRAAVVAIVLLASGLVAGRRSRRASRASQGPARRAG